MAHLTAGDVYPISAGTETTYGTAASTLAYYGDVAEGGRITLQDNPNPHLAWRYGSRTRDADDYVGTQQDAGFSATMEARDVSGWSQIITNAYSAFGSSLPARTVGIGTTATATGRKYMGCKTDSLTVSADAPGGIVRFEETVLAAYASVVTASAPTVTDAAAVQWLGGATVGGASVYPQRFSLSIANNLERIRGPAFSGQTVGSTATVALVEGRCDISFEMDVWLDDLSYMGSDMANTDAPSSIALSIGSDNAVSLTLSDLTWMADGQHADLKQDKMMQTLRYRVGTLTVA